MYITLKSGETALVGRWPTTDEIMEIEEQLERGLTYDDKAVVILSGDKPMTALDLKKTETRIKNTILRIAGRRRRVRQRS